MLAGFTRIGLEKSLAMRVQLFEASDGRLFDFHGFQSATVAHAALAAENRPQP